MKISYEQRQAIVKFLYSNKVQFTSSVEALRKGSTDFGNIESGCSYLTVQPKNAKDVAALIKLANRENFQITARGGGGSQSGQSIPKDGITLDTSRLDFVDLDSCTKEAICGSGNTWRQILAFTTMKGMLPCTMPLNLDLTFGGTLSVGGFGASTHHFGSVVSNISALEAVTGNGDTVKCSPSQNQFVYDGALANLGRCAVITSANILLRDFQPNVRVYYLIYDDINLWLEDQRQLAKSQTIDYLEGFCSVTTQGLYNTSNGYRPLKHWFYGLHIGLEFTKQPPMQKILSNLNYFRLLHIEDNSTIDYLARYDTRFHMMQQTGAWQQPHPWFECILPVDTASEAITSIIDTLPSFFGDGHRIFMISSDAKDPKFLIKPEEPVCLFAILPIGIPSSLLQSALDTIVILDEILVRYGGKRYLSGWLSNQNSEFWQLHFAEQYDSWQKTKQMLDFNNVLCSKLFS